MLDRFYPGFGRGDRQRVAAFDPHPHAPQDASVGLARHPFGKAASFAAQRVDPRAPLGPVGDHSVLCDQAERHRARDRGLAAVLGGAIKEYAGDHLRDQDADGEDRHHLPEQARGEPAPHLSPATGATRRTGAAKR